jgi:hypothetical protein
VLGRLGRAVPLLVHITVPPVHRRRSLGLALKLARHQECAIFCVMTVVVPACTCTAKAKGCCLRVGLSHETNTYMPELVLSIQNTHVVQVRLVLEYTLCTHILNTVHHTSTKYKACATQRACTVR